MMKLRKIPSNLINMYLPAAINFNNCLINMYLPAAI